MPPTSGTFVGTFYPNEVGGGPIYPPSGGGQPPGIWGGGNVPMPTPPIYIPVPPPEGGGEPGVPTHPIYIPVFPSHPIVIPMPPEGEKPQPPIIWPPGIWGGPGGLPPFPAHPIAPGGGGQPPLGIWGGAPLPVPTPPIYYPVEPPEGGGGGEVTPPIYFPVFPAHPIAPGGPPEAGQPPLVIWGGAPLPVPTPPIYLPPLPPAMINPPSGARGFWGYSVHYQSAVFVPYEGAGTGTIGGGGGPEMPPAVPSR